MCIYIDNWICKIQKVDRMKKIDLWIISYSKITKHFFIETINILKLIHFNKKLISYSKNK